MSESNNSGSAITLSGSAKVFISATSEDLALDEDYGLITGTVGSVDDYGALA